MFLWVSGGKLVCSLEDPVFGCLNCSSIPFLRYNYIIPFLSREEHWSYREIDNRVDLRKVLKCSTLSFVAQ
jgi:hypothetical protein